MMTMTGFDAGRVPLFQGLTGCEITSLLAAARHREVPAGACFFHQADAALHCHLLVAGEVRLVEGDAAGGQVILRFIGPGDVFGWPKLFGSALYPASAEAAADSRALVWDEAVLRSLMAVRPRLALNTLEMVGARLHDLQDRLCELATERVESRVARALLRLAERHGRRQGEEVEIAFRLSRQDLADATGATLSTVSRILAAWRQRGLLRGGRRRVIIHPGRLARHAGRDEANAENNTGLDKAHR